MERKGEAARGRAVQQWLILWLSVVWDIVCVFWFLRTKLWDLWVIDNKNDG